MLNRLTKSYEIYTTMSIDDILKSIEINAETNKIKYRSFKVNDRIIQVDRWPSIFNPLKGNGIITYELSNCNDGTTIKCTYGPVKLAIYMGLGLMILAFILLLRVMLSISWESFNKKVFTILIILVLPLGLMLLFSYLLLVFNTNQLEDYSKTVLKDLRIIY